jgi:ribosome-associated protein
MPISPPFGADEIEDEGSEFVSKTRRKKEMHALQELGEALVALPAARLAQLELPEVLRDAILEARRIHKFGALKRQMQFIGRLMRDVEAAPIRARLDAWEGHSREETARMHRLERLRERLLEDDKAFGEVAEAFPQADLQHLRALARAARQERTANKPPRNARALFRALRELFEESGEE